MKKLLLGLGAVATAASPIAAVVSCGTSDKKETTTNDAVIDIESLSTQELIEELNEKINFIMPKDAASMVTKSHKLQKFVEDEKNDIKKYMEGIKLDENIVLKSGDKKFTLDLSGVKKASSKIIELFTKPVGELFTNEDIGNISGEAMTKPVPNISGYTGHLYGSAFGMPYGMRMMPFMYLGSKGTTTKNHEYYNLLREWHKALYPFVESDLYKSWIAGKTFKFITFKGIQDGSKSTREVKPGEEFDISKTLSSATMPMFENPNQPSNFEALFTQNILNIKSLSLPKPPANNTP